MTVSTNKVILYAADSTDYKIALEAAAKSGISAANVTGNFTKAWSDVASGEYLVFAVGGPALNALYYNPCDWTAAEVTFLHEQGVRILPIFNNFSRATEYADGVTEANDAIAVARRLGIPKGVVIFADIEADYVVDEAWIRGWADIMEKSKYVPGIYHNPITGGSSQAYCTAVRNDATVARNVILWSNEREPGITTKANAPAWHPSAPPCSGRTLAWQYGENGTAGSHGIDTDLVHPSLLPYLW